MYQSSCWKLCIRGGFLFIFIFFFDVLHVLPSCVWADPLNACSPITHQPQLLLTKKKRNKQKKQPLQVSFVPVLRCDVSRLGNETSSASNATPGAVCIPPTLFSTKLTAGDQYGSILNSASVSLRQLKFSSPEAAPQIYSLNLTWLDSAAAETHTANVLIQSRLFVL